MSELHLTHIALVGARMSAFKPYGFHDRNQLAMRRITPDIGGRSIEAIPAGELPAVLRAELPIWIHNMIADPGFPGRDNLLMPLRRFEGELCDGKSDEVVALVLSAGFKNQTLDPLNLPGGMPLRHDGNNVSLESENVLLAKNAMTARTMMRLLARKYRMLKSAVSGRVR